VGVHYAEVHTPTGSNSAEKKKEKKKKEKAFDPSPHLSRLGGFFSSFFRRDIYDVFCCRYMIARKKEKKKKPRIADVPAATTG